MQNTNPVPSEAELDALVKSVSERCEAATPGPWVIDDIDDWIESRGVKDRVSEPTHDWEFRTIVDGGYWTNPESDKEFVAHAREDIPRLLDAITALRKREPTEAMVDMGVETMLDILEDMGITGIDSGLAAAFVGRILEAALRPQAEAEKK